MKYINNLIEFVSGCKNLASQMNHNFSLLREKHNNLLDQINALNEHCHYRLHELEARTHELEKRTLALEDGLAFWSGFSKATGWKIDKLEKIAMEEFLLALEKINNVKEVKIVEYDADTLPKEPVPYNFKDALKALEILNIILKGGKN